MLYVFLFTTVELLFTAKEKVGKVKLATIVEGNQKAPFSIATPILELLHFILDTYLILLSVMQGGIKYHF